MNLPTAACKTNGSAFIALISDISSSGASVKTSRSFTVGQEVTMTINFPATGESRMVTGESPLPARSCKLIGVRQSATRKLPGSPGDKDVTPSRPYIWLIMPN